MGSAALVHVIEDNQGLATGIRNVLEIEGYRVRVDNDGVSGMNAARASHPDLVILDLMLPEMDGYQLLKALRAAGESVPVLILSARGEESDKIHGFRLGADDYVTKPFSLLELTERVAALLRRTRVPAEPTAPVAISDEIEIDFTSRTVSRAGMPVALAPKQFDLLAALAARRGAVASRAEMLREVWGYRRDVTSRTLDMHILELRRKLEDNAASPKLILTVRSIGYRLAR